MPIMPACANACCPWWTVRRGTGCWRAPSRCKAWARSGAGRRSLAKERPERRIGRIRHIETEPALVALIRVEIGARRQPDAGLQRPGREADGTLRARGRLAGPCPQEQARARFDGNLEIRLAHHLADLVVSLAQALPHAAQVGALPAIAQHPVGCALHDFR